MPIKKKIIAKKKPKNTVETSKVKPIGVVTHFYGAIKVAIVRFKKAVKVGTTVNFSGATTNFSQKIVSLQYDHKPLTIAPKGKEIGVKVGKRVREGDEVFLVEE